MRRINTLADLRAEKKELLLRKIYLEAEIKKDIEEIKTDLEPLRLLAKGAKGILSSKNNSILGSSAGLAADFITKHTLLKNSGFLAKLIIPFLVKNVTSNIVENNKSKVVSWVENLVSKFTNKKTSEEHM